MFIFGFFINRVRIGKKPLKYLSWLLLAPHHLWPHLHPRVVQQVVGDRIPMPLRFPILSYLLKRNYQVEINFNKFWPNLGFLIDNEYLTKWQDAPWSSHTIYHKLRSLVDDTLVLRQSLIDPKIHSHLPLNLIQKLPPIKRRRQQAMAHRLPDALFHFHLPILPLSRAGRDPGSHK